MTPKASLPVLGGLLTIAALVAFAGAASAEYYEGKEECPPDMMCTTSTEDSTSGQGDGTNGSAGETGNTTDGSGDGDKADGGTADGEQPTRGADGDCEEQTWCPRSGGNGSTEEPQHAGWPQDTGGDTTCMDGDTAYENCDDDVQYLDGGAGNDDPIPYGDGIADSGPRGDTSEGDLENAGAGDKDPRTVPAAGGLALLAIGLGVVGLGVARRKA